MATAKVPTARSPCTRGWTFADGENGTDRCAQTCIEEASQPFAFERVDEFGVRRVDVDWQFALAPKIIIRVFVRMKNCALCDTQAGCDGLEQRKRICGGRRSNLRLSIWRFGTLVGQERAVFPKRHTVSAPIQIE